MSLVLFPSHVPIESTGTRTRTRREWGVSLWVRAPLPIPGHPSFSSPFFRRPPASKSLSLCVWVNCAELHARRTQFLGSIVPSSQHLVPYSIVCLSCPASFMVTFPYAYFHKLLGSYTRAHGYSTLFCGNSCLSGPKSFFFYHSPSYLISSSNYYSRLFLLFPVSFVPYVFLNHFPPILENLTMRAGS
jgi:hypothetical protein